MWVWLSGNIHVGLKYWLNLLKQEEMQMVMFLTCNFKLVHLNWKLRILTLFYVLSKNSNMSLMCVIPVVGVTN